MSFISELRIDRIACAALVILLAGVSLARADVLDRGVRFNIAVEPLANALIEFSTQCGVQIAVADIDVSGLQSNAVNGDYPIREALGILLRGTGLVFVRAGDKTLAIRSAPILPAVGNLARARPRPLEAAAAASTSPPATISADIPDVTVIAARPPTDTELAGDSVYQFILHHGTTHFPSSIGVRGSLTRWRGGRSQTICPLTLGLEPGYNAFVTARIRALAINVGAPVQPDSGCEPNVKVIFTADPKKPMDEALKVAGASLGVGYPHQTERQKAISGSHAIQGWFLTTGGGSRALNTDPALIGHVNLLPLWPYAIVTSVNSRADAGSGIVGVLIVVDTTKFATVPIGALADYAAVISLTVAQSPDHCDPLPSILDLTSSTCGARELPSRITAGDVAFLKALYFHNTGLGPT
ncbi:MAG TPA: STN domain-containing protein, partial [Steroidobacteraceae bacterium]